VLNRLIFKALEMKDQKILFIGVDLYQTGIANFLVYMTVSRGGIIIDQMGKRIFMIDKDSLVRKGLIDFFDFNVSFMHDIQLLENNN
jgi:malic enzyme